VKDQVGRFQCVRFKFLCIGADTARTFKRFDSNEAYSTMAALATTCATVDDSLELASQPEQDNTVSAAPKISLKMLHG